MEVQKISYIELYLLLKDNLKFLSQSKTSKKNYSKSKIEIVTNFFETFERQHPYAFWSAFIDLLTFEQVDYFVKKCFYEIKEDADNPCLPYFARFTLTRPHVDEKASVDRLDAESNNRCLSGKV